MTLPFTKIDGRHNIGFDPIPLSSQFDLRTRAADEFDPSLDGERERVD